MTRWVTLAALADETGLAVRTLQYIRAQEPGVLPVRTRGKGKGLVTEYEQPACAVNLRRREAEKAAKEIQPVDLDAARTRKALAEAELAELEVAKARGEWVSVKDAGDALGKALDVVSARLRSLGPSFSRFGPEVEAAAEAEAERILTELHGWDGDVLDEPEPDDKAA